MTSHWLGSSPKFFTWPPSLPQDSRPARLLPTWRPLAFLSLGLSATTSPFFPQTNSDSSLCFRLSLHFPGNVCLPSWAYVTVSLVLKNRQRLNTHGCLFLRTRKGRPAGLAGFTAALSPTPLAGVCLGPRNRAKSPSKIERPKELHLKF